MQNTYLNSLAFLYKLDKARQATQQQKIQHNNFTEFKHQFWHGYIHTPFHDKIDEALESVYQYLETGVGISRLMICMPPRYGKTQSVSRKYPGYVLGRNPDISIILTSYSARLAQKNSRAVRNLIKSAPYQKQYPNTRLDPEKTASDEWQLLGREGGIVTAGVEGGITGFGGRLIIVDDAIKNRADAESEVIRQNIHTWYTDDLYTRLEDLKPSAIVIINTRWHFDDLSGWLLSDNIDDWTVLNFPAITTPENVENDSLGRAVGVPLWSAKHDENELRQKEAQMGSYSFESLFQQNPSQTKGRLFDKTDFEIIPPEKYRDFVSVVRFYDLGATAKSRSSYSVGLKLGLTYDNYFVVLDVYRAQAEMPDVEKAIKANALLDGIHCPIILETEKGGIIELQYLHRDASMNAYTMNLQTPEGDKYTRATPIAGKVKARRVLLVDAIWNKTFLDELSMFPSGKWNDQVDAFSGAYKALAPDTYASAYNEIANQVLSNYRGLTSG